jgi:2-polyprenyl-6-methoxyphenol hydroxylase-like FAD-dependent oxidoreductase
MTRAPRIAIIGGGVGSLAAAPALERRGAGTLVYEQFVRARPRSRAERSTEFAARRRDLTDLLAYRNEICPIKAQGRLVSL